MLARYLIVCKDRKSILKDNKELARMQAHREKNSGPARKIEYFVFIAFAHEHSILIGCFL
jgi:hypothetical protein